MAAPIDFTSRAQAVAKTTPPASPRLCGWCLGSGKYLEALDCGVAHTYLPVVCEACNGTGHRPSA
jgi:DnaJ-class molecular chaperone